MKAKAKVWIVFGDEVKLGDGRAELLQRIGERGSIQRAVAEFGMSYRNAWGYLRDLERAAGFKLLERKPGGPRGGTRLTTQGEEFLTRYGRFRRAVDAAIEREFNRSFGGGADPGRSIGSRSTVGRRSWPSSRSSSSRGSRSRLAPK
jgi:molybdate transport system regulatory protein